ncbi:MAG: outer membrane protein assembly factor BamA, partial [Thermodesulfobacteriota bacterium]
TRDIEELKDFYGDKGYAYVDVKPRTDVHTDARTVDLTFNIRKNDLVYVDRINILGNTRTRDKVIRREFYIEEEELYSSTKVKKSRYALKRLGFFDDVAIDKVRGKTPDKIDLHVTVEERPTGSISAGIGYSSVDSIIGTASIAQSNLFGTGLNLNLSGTLSASSSRFVMSFTEPYLLDKNLSAGVDLYNTSQEFQGFNTRKKGFSLRTGFPVYKRDTKAFIAYTLEDAEVLDVSTDASVFIKEQEGSRTESSVTLTLTRDTRDDAFFPRRGSVVTYTGKVSGGVLGGNVYTLKHQLNAIQYFPTPLNTTFSIRAQGGYLRGYAGRDAPIYERFFLGGINTIRGFDTRSISPKDPVTNDLIGGETMWVGNAEFLFPLVKGQKMRGLLFFDVGNTYTGKVDFADVRFATGTGVRWYSPVGPLRLELGINLNPRDDESRTQWDFTIGSTF